MEKYLSDLTEVIAEGAMENTYKMAWARALVELCVKNPERQKFHFDEFAFLIFKYYWNQSVFFSLQQGPSATRRPEIHAMVLRAIEEFQRKRGPQPRTFIEVAQDIDVPLQRISAVLSIDVCKRFLRLGKTVIDIYEYDLKKRTIQVKYPELINEHADLLLQLINYRWAQKLEDLDGSPRIAKKIKGVDREQIPKRASLTKFKKYLDVNGLKPACFLSRKLIADGEVAIDHVIPWSYLYADNLWNLVLVDRRENSSKGNRIPDEGTILRLEERNRDLLRTLQRQGLQDKHVAELKIAIDRDYVRRFWIGCRG